MDALRRAPDQLGFVTDDLERTVGQLRVLWDEPEWSVHEYDQQVLGFSSYRGQPGRFASRNAVADGGRIGVVQPLAGPSVHLDALTARGPGLAYLTWFVSALDDVAERLGRAHAEEVMRGGGHGLDGDGEFVYYDTVEILGVYSQYVVRPRRRRPPARQL